MRKIKWKLGSGGGSQYYRTIHARNEPAKSSTYHSHHHQHHQLTVSVKRTLRTSDRAKLTCQRKATKILKTCANYVHFLFREFTKRFQRFQIQKTFQTSLSDLTSKLRVQLVQLMASKKYYKPQETAPKPQNRIDKFDLKHKLWLNTVSRVKTQPGQSVCPSWKHRNEHLPILSSQSSSETPPPSQNHHGLQNCRRRFRTRLLWTGNSVVNCRTKPHSTQQIRSSTCQQSTGREVVLSFQLRLLVLFEWVNFQRCVAAVWGMAPCQLLLLDVWPCPWTWLWLCASAWAASKPVSRNLRTSLAKRFLLCKQ